MADFEIYDRRADEAEALYGEWEKGRPCTPSDYPDENAAYVAGYVAACEKHEATIVLMREALDILKVKWQEAEGEWAGLDFMDAGLHPENSDHWVRKVIEAERLSQPFVDETKNERAVRI